MHTSPTNKHYIGITKQQPPSNRWRKDGKGYKNSIYFWNAIQKYGWDNFKHVIVAEGLSLNEASEMEKDLVYRLFVEREFNPPMDICGLMRMLIN